jgi:hypothetical protein
VSGSRQFSAEQQARAVRLVAEARPEYPSEWAAMKVGLSAASRWIGAVTSSGTGGPPVRFG